MARIFSVTSVSLTILKSNPIQILVVAHGMAATSGWKNIDLVPVKGSDGDGILDLEFVGTPPKGISLQVLTPVTGDFVITENAEKLSGVLVLARSNQMTALVGNAAGQPEGAGGGELARQLTTFAIGEEGGPINTAAIGEHTWVFGESQPFQFETFPLHPSESLVFRPSEKLPILETDPFNDLNIPTKLSIGEFGPRPGPGPDPAPDLTRFTRTPFGG